MFEELEALAVKVGTHLVARGEQVAVAESSAGGLISAALLAVPGASRFFAGGAVVYTAASLKALLDLSRDALKAQGSLKSRADYAARIAVRVRERHDVAWGLGEAGLAGPTGGPRGEPAGLTGVAVAGPRPASRVLETGSADRSTNMVAFARATLVLFLEQLEAAGAPGQ